MRLGEMLLERQLIITEDFERALELQKDCGEKIGKIFVDVGFAAARDVLGAFSEQLHVPLVSIEGPPAVFFETEKLSLRFLWQFRCLSVALHGSTFTLA